MIDEHCATSSRTNSLTIIQAAEIAEIARAIGMTELSLLFLEIAFILADGGVVTEDFRQEIDMLRASALARTDIHLNEKQRMLIGVRPIKIRAFPSRAYAVLFSSGKRSCWP